MSKAHPTPSFESLGLSPALIGAVAQEGFATPTAVQVRAIPAVLDGRDVVGCAQTGTGKTLAFGLPLLQRLGGDTIGARPRGNHARALILVPTRELATQIEGVLRHFAAQLPSPPDTLAVHGGPSINPQMMALRGGVDLLVATPGRLLDLHRHNAVQLSQTATLVLDEADRMLELGFADELSEVLARLPPRRQTLLFSATFPPKLTDIVAATVRDPVEIGVSTQAQSEPLDMEERVFAVDTPRKTALLIELIRTRELARVLVFVSVKKTGNRLVSRLRSAGIAASAFHGDRSQAERQRALSDFHRGNLSVLVATDLAARGIDIEALPAVVNFELPRSPADYVHRIGRTARAGKSGLAVTFVSAAEEAHFRVIEKRMKRRVPREQVAGFEPQAEGRVSSGARASSPVAPPPTYVLHILTHGRRYTEAYETLAAAQQAAVALRDEPRETPQQITRGDHLEMDAAALARLTESAR